MKNKILIVDDIEMNRFLLRTFLKDDFNVYEAENGQIAIDLIKKNIFKMVFMDIQMPVMNGFESIKYIRENLDKDLPIIIVTGFSNIDLNDNIEEDKYNGILFKPLSLNKISKLIEKYN